MNLDAILKLIGQVNTLLPAALALEKAVMAMFALATEGLSPTERIALLRAAGVKLEDRGEAWLAEHGLA